MLPEARVNWRAERCWSSSASLRHSRTLGTSMGSGWGMRASATPRARCAFIAQARGASSASSASTIPSARSSAASPAAGSAFSAVSSGWWERGAMPRASRQAIRSAGSRRGAARAPRPPRAARQRRAPARRAPRPPPQLRVAASPTRASPPVHGPSSSTTVARARRAARAELGAQRRGPGRARAVQQQAGGSAAGGSRLSSSWTASATAAAGRVVRAGRELRQRDVGGAGDRDDQRDRRHQLERARATAPSMPASRGAHAPATTSAQQRQPPAHAAQPARRARASGR